MLKIAGFVVALLAATTLPVAPASAGDGRSEWCSDGMEYEYSITNPVVVGYDIKDYNQFTICYANSPAGYTGSHVVGGAFLLYINPSSATLFCIPDSNPATVVLGCWISGFVNPANGLVSLSVMNVTTDTALTSPVTVNGTGITVPSVIDGGGQPDPRYPCVAVLSNQLVPTCYQVILP